MSPTYPAVCGCLEHYRFVPDYRQPVGPIYYIGHRSECLSPARGLYRRLVSGGWFLSFLRIVLQLPIYELIYLCNDCVLPGDVFVRNEGETTS